MRSRRSGRSRRVRREDQGVRDRDGEARRGREGRRPGRDRAAAQGHRQGLRLLPRRLPQAEGRVVQAQQARRRLRSLRGAAVALATAALIAAAPARGDDAQIARGRAVLEASGGCTCHTDFKSGHGAPLSGCTADALRRLLQHQHHAGSRDRNRQVERRRFRARDARASRPTATSYFPVFPYTSFTGMSDEDVFALKAYLFSLPPVRRENRPHDAMPPFRWRIAAAAWRWYGIASPAASKPFMRTPEWNRGAYLVSAVAHCGECHTPRTLSGALDRSRWLAGSKDGPEGDGRRILRRTRTPGSACGRRPTWSGFSRPACCRTATRPKA